jgi:hypothetical protein
MTGRECSRPPRQANAARSDAARQRRRASAVVVGLVTRWLGERRHPDRPAWGEAGPSERSWDAVVAASSVAGWIGPATGIHLWVDTGGDNAIGRSADGPARTSGTRGVEDKQSEPRPATPPEGRAPADQPGGSEPSPSGGWRLDAFDDRVGFGLGERPHRVSGDAA